MGHVMYSQTDCDYSHENIILFPIYTPMHVQSNNAIISWKEKNQCPREGMFSGSFAKARGRDEG
jgi:hypothetical protein